MTWGTIVPALPLYIDRFGATAAVLGAIIAAFGLGRALVNIPAGLALRWWRPRPFLHVVCWALVVVTALTGLSSDVGALIGARVLAGILGGSAITVGFAVLVGGAPADRRGRVMSTATAVQMSAGAVGAFLGGLALTWLPLALAFVVAAVPLAVCLVVDLVRPAASYWAAALGRSRSRSRELVGAAVQPGAGADADAGAGADADGAAAAPAAPAAPAATAGSVRDIASARPPGQRGIASVVIALAIASFAVFAARFGGEQGLIPLLGYAGGGLNPFTLGLALAAATVVSLGAMLVVGPLLDRGFRLRILVPSVVAAAGAMAVFPFATGPVAFAAAIIAYGLASCIASVVPSVVMSEAVPSSRSGFVVGVTRTAGDVGAVVGPLVALAVFDAFGPVAAAVLLAVLIAVAHVPLGVLLCRRVANCGCPVG